MPSVYFMSKVASSLFQHVPNARLSMFIYFFLYYLSRFAVHVLVLTQYSICRTLKSKQVGWLVGCLGFNGPLRQYFSLYRAVSQREGDKRREMIDESTNIQTTPTRTYCKRSRPLPYYHSNCRTPQHWKFTQYHRTTRPPLSKQERRYCLTLHIKVFWFSDDPLATHL